MKKNELSRRGFLVTSGAGASALAWTRAAHASEDAPLRIVVMDPLSAPLACKCVAGYAQRDYGKLAAYLRDQLRREVLVAYTESLAALTKEERRVIDVIVGKSSVVRFDAARTGLSLRKSAMLSGRAGRLSQTGLFVVRSGDPAKSLADLEGYRIEFGPAESEEKYAAALAALRAEGLPVPKAPHVNTACSTAALAVLEHDADAAVISSYAIPLLEGCGAVDKGALRVVGHTRAVPFVEVFVTDRVSEDVRRGVTDALARMRTRPELLAALETKNGFVIPARKKA